MTDFGVIGNCAVAALIDRDALVVWHFLPRFDGDLELTRSWESVK
jgi:hypothetical protein